MRIALAVLFWLCIYSIASAQHQAECTTEWNGERGGGVSISNGYVLTCGHGYAGSVLRVGQRYTCYFPSLRRTVSGVVVAAENRSQIDLALISTREMDLPHIEIAAEDPAVGTKVWMCNPVHRTYPTGKIWRYSRHSAYGSMLQSTVKSIPGDSGSPIINREGKLVGVLKGGGEGSSASTIWAFLARAERSRQK